MNLSLTPNLSPARWPPICVMHIYADLRPVERNPDRNGDHHHEPDTNDAVTEDSYFALYFEFRQQLDDDVVPSVDANHTTIDNTDYSETQKNPFMTLSSRMAMMRQTQH